MCWGKLNKLKKDWSKLKNKIRLCVVTPEDTKRIHLLQLQKRLKGYEKNEDILMTVKKTKNENKMPIINLKAIHPKFNKK